MVRYEKEDHLNDFQRQEFEEQFGCELEHEEKPFYWEENLEAVVAARYLENQLIISPMGQILGYDVRAVFDYCRFKGFSPSESEILITKLKVIEKELYHTERKK